MAFSAPLVDLLGIRGALCGAGLAAIVAGGVALVLRLHHLRGDAAAELRLGEGGSLAPGVA
jgi:hypothetical protein